MAAENAETTARERGHDIEARCKGRWAHRTN